MQILATDFDGTLYRNGTVSDADKAAVAHFRAAGNKFGIVTGRHMATALYETQKQAVSYDFLICCTGGIILDSQNNILFERRIPKEAVIPLMQKTTAFGGEFFCVSDFQKLFWYDTGFPSMYDSAAILPVEHLYQLESFHEMSTRFSDEQTAGQYVNTLNMEYPEWLTAHQNGIYVDICAPCTDKVSGLMSVLQYFNASESKLSVVGDNLNDLSMIRAFHAFAMENGRTEVKAEANHTVSDFSEIMEILL